MLSRDPMIVCIFNESVSDLASLTGADVGVVCHFLKFWKPKKMCRNREISKEEEGCSQGEGGASTRRM